MEAIYLRYFLQELGVESSQIVLYNHNQGTGELVKNFPVFYSQIKDKDIRHHLVHKAYELRKIEVHQE